jgi:hypothetical protein
MTRSRFLGSLSCAEGLGATSDLLEFILRVYTRFVLRLVKLIRIGWENFRARQQA